MKLDNLIDDINLPNLHKMSIQAAYVKLSICNWTEGLELFKLVLEECISNSEYLSEVQEFIENCSSTLELKSLVERFSGRFDSLYFHNAFASLDTCLSGGWIYSEQPARFSSLKKSLSWISYFTYQSEDYIISSRDQEDSVIIAESQKTYDEIELSLFDLEKAYSENNLLIYTDRPAFIG